MADDHDSSDDEINLFRELMSDVTPLPSDNRVEPEARTRTTRVHDPRPFSNSDSSATQNRLIQSDYVPSVGPDEVLFFAHPGLQEKARKRLRLGKIPSEARLDLHGKTIAQAAQLLDDFLQQSQFEGLRCVLVIHGRGHRSQGNQPVLKAQVNHWLREHPAVLAFASAQPQHGGVGAVYVMLRKTP